MDSRTGKRKTPDRISHSQFKDKKTGFCSKIIYKAVQSLVLKGLIAVTDKAGNQPPKTSDRKGNTRLFSSFQPSYFIPLIIQSSLGLVYKSIIVKTKLYKTKEAKLSR
jgi:hypothetical protein